MRVSLATQRLKVWGETMLEKLDRAVGNVLMHGAGVFAAFCIGFAVGVFCSVTVLAARYLFWNVIGEGATPLAVGVLFGAFHAAIAAVALFIQGWNEE